MTWKEAQDAFRQQVPVLYLCERTPEPIVCTRIAEIAVRCDRYGNRRRVVAGMDRNENCLYHDDPEKFELLGGNNGEEQI